MMLREVANFHVRGAGTVPASYPQTKPNAGEGNAGGVTGKVLGKRSLSGMILQTRQTQAGDNAAKQAQASGVDPFRENRQAQGNQQFHGQASAAIRAVAAVERGAADPGDNVRTFSNLGTMAKRASSAGKTGVDMVGALRRVATTSIPRDENARDDTDDRAGQSEYSIPPMDWGLKSRIRITAPSSSMESLSWAVSMHARTEVDAMINFASLSALSPSPSSTNGEGADEGRRRGVQGRGIHNSTEECTYDTCSGPVEASTMQAFRESTLSWLHPAEQLSPAVLGAMNAESPSDGASDSMLTMRRHAWRRSFRSLYSSLRAGKARMFYVHCQECTAIFMDDRQHRKVRSLGGGGGPCVMVAHQRSGIRQALADSGVELHEFDAERQSNVHRTDGDHEFAGGFCSQGQAMDTERSDGEEEDDALEAGEKGAPSMGVPARKVANGIVFITGSLDVNTVYDVMFNYFASHSVREDVPQLLSPTPFIGATLSQATVRSGRMQRAVGDGGMESLHVLEVGGVLPPWVIQRCCRSLEGVCASSFEAVFSPVSSSIAPHLNVGFARLRREDANRARMADGVAIVPPAEAPEHDSKCDDAFFGFALSLYPLNNVEDVSRSRELGRVSWNGACYTAAL